MSEPTKQAFIKAATSAQSSDANWKSLSISEIRALGESALQMGAGWHKAKSERDWHGDAGSLS